VLVRRLADAREHGLCDSRINDAAIGGTTGLTGRATVLLALLLTATATFAPNCVDDFRIL